MEEQNRVPEASDSAENAAPKEQTPANPTNAKPVPAQGSPAAAQDKGNSNSLVWIGLGILGVIGLVHVLGNNTDKQKRRELEEENQELKDENERLMDEREKEESLQRRKEKRSSRGSAFFD